jgi:hypothetical protein
MSLADEWVSAEFSCLADLINEYDSDLFLEMIPVAEQVHLTDKSKVFRIVDDRLKTVVMTFDSLANPTDILAGLWSRDLKHGDVIGRMDKRNAAIEALRLKEKIDEADAIKDFTAFVGKNTKSRWHHEGHVRDDEFRDLGPVRSHIT